MNELIKFYDEQLCYRNLIYKKTAKWNRRLLLIAIFIFLVVFVLFMAHYLSQSILYASILFLIASLFVQYSALKKVKKKHYPSFFDNKGKWNSSRFQDYLQLKLRDYLVEKNINDGKIVLILEYLERQKTNSLKSFTVFSVLAGLLLVPIWSAYVDKVINTQLPLKEINFISFVFVFIGVLLCCLFTNLKELVSSLYARYIQNQILIDLLTRARIEL